MPGGYHEHSARWEPEEDALIIKLLSELGPRWSKIALALPGRSIPSIRNRWLRIDKAWDRKCHKCGKLRRAGAHSCKAVAAAEEDALLADILPDATDLEKHEPAEVNANPSQPETDVPPTVEVADDEVLEIAAEEATVEEMEIGDIVEESAAGYHTPIATPARALSPEPPSTMFAASGPFRSFRRHHIEEGPFRRHHIEDDGVVPIICRMRSGHRISRELGFEAAAAAVSEESALPSPPVILPVRDFSNRSVNSDACGLTVEIGVRPSRMPSLQFASPTGLVTGMFDDDDAPGVAARRSFGDAAP